MELENTLKVVGSDGATKLFALFEQGKIDEDHLEGLEKLCKTGMNRRLRSELRISLYTQVVMWRIKIDAGEDVFNSPLSPKQWNCLLPFKPYGRR